MAQLNANQIFICGMPRSGTTWLGKIFDSHPKTLYLHEPDSILNLDSVPLFVSNEKSHLDAVKKYTQNLSHCKSIRIYGKYPIFKKDYYTPFSFALRKYSIILGKSLSRIVGDFNVPSYVNYKKCKDINLVWKSIDSAGRLSAVVQGQHIRGLLLIRHPCGQIASSLRGEKLGKFNSYIASEDYGYFELLLKTNQAQQHDLSMPLIKKMKPIERLAWKWLIINEHAFEQAETNINCRIIIYDSFCRNPLEDTKKLFQFTNLEMTNQTRTFINSCTVKSKKEYYSICKIPEIAANRWKNELTSNQIHTVTKIIKKSNIPSLVSSFI